MQELETLRSQIDSIDQQLLDLLAERFLLVKQVGAFKKMHQITLLQPNRWQQVLESKIAYGQTVGIEEEFIKTVWNAIHEYALQIEYHIQEDWGKE